MTDKHVGAVIVHQHDLVIRLRIIFPQNVYQDVADVLVAVVGAEDEGEHKIRPIGHFAGCDMAGSLVKTSFPADSKLSRGKLSFKNAL